ncbi:MAG: hypothetical protein IKE05_01025, partial [Clostridia bacterium]|nr:hypothetical protein [Clostridia bacterium]
MKPLNFKKLFCVMLSASILFPNVAKANPPREVPPVPSGRKSSKSAEFMKKNWPYFVASIPGAALIAGVVGVGIYYRNKNHVPDTDSASNDMGDVGTNQAPVARSPQDWENYVKSLTDIGQLPGAIVFRYETAGLANFFSGKPLYFYVITNSKEFNNYLETRCRYGNSSTAFNLIKKWANKITYDISIQGDKTYTYQNLFNEHNAGLFAQDLTAAINALNDDPNKKNADICLEGNRPTIGDRYKLYDNSQPTKDAMSTDFRSAWSPGAFSNMAGKAALSMNALSALCAANAGCEITSMTRSIDTSGKKD